MIKFDHERTAPKTKEPSLQVPSLELPKADPALLPMIVINDEEKSSSGILHRDYTESHSNATRGIDSPTKETMGTIMPPAAVPPEEEKQPDFSRADEEEEKKAEPLLFSKKSPSPPKQTAASQQASRKLNKDLF